MLSFPSLTTRMIFSFNISNLLLSYTFLLYQSIAKIIINSTIVTTPTIACMVGVDSCIIVVQ
jgi:hypothetical protein